MKIIGVDVGNCTTINSKGVIFDSKVTKNKGITSLSSLEIDNQMFYLGAGDYDTTYRKVEKSSYITLLYGSIALGIDEKNVNLVLGLPISQYSADKNDLISLVLNNQHKKIKINGITKEFYINDVEVYPEGAVTVPDTFEGVIVDIGGRTTDCCLVENVNGNRNIEEHISLPLGTLNLYTNFINRINSDYGLDLKDKDAIRVITKGLHLDGKIIELTEELNIFDEFIDNLVSQLKVKYSLRTYDVSVTGGGGRFLFNLLKERIPQCILQENALTANAEAYEQLGRSIWE